MREPTDPVNADATSFERELLRHAGGLRALATAVLRDEASAEDVIQDTWMAALTRPPRAMEALGGWVRAVAGSGALKRLRGEQRRREREAACARPEALPAADESAARREALLRLTRAVVELDEPYHAAIVARYFDGRTPAEIAAGAGVPLATVKSRLQRGLAKLRERLERDGLDGRELARGLALVAGLAPRAPVAELASPTSAGPAVAAMTGTMAMGTKIFWSAAGVVALAGAWLGAQRLLEPAGAAAHGGGAPLDSGGSGGSAESAPAALAAAADAGPADDRAPISAAPAAAAASRHASAAAPDEPYEFELELSVLDEADLPVAGAAILIAPERHALNAAGTADAAGRLRLRWRARVPTLAVALDARHMGASAGLVRRELGAGANAAVLRVPSAPGGEHIGTGTAFVDLGVGGGITERRLRMAVELSGGAPSLLFDDEGLATFVTPSGPCSREQALSSELEIVEYTEGISAFSIGVGSGSLRVATLEGASADAPRPLASLRGRVLDASGEPVPHAHIALGPTRERIAWLGTADESGEFALEGIEPGSFVLRAGGGDRGLAWESFQLAGGEAREWNPVLDRGDVLAGRLLDERGAPLAGWRVQAERRGAGAPWADAATTLADGRFAIPNCASGALRVLALAPDAAWLAAHAFYGLWADGQETALVVDDQARRTGALALRLDWPSGEAHRGAEVVVWQLATGLGERLTVDLGEGRLAHQRLPLGDYLVEAGAAGHAWISAGTARVATEGLSDLGRFALEPCATLHAGAVPAAEPAATPVQVRSAELAGELVLTEDFVAAEGARFEKRRAPAEIHLLRPDVRTRLWDGRLGDPPALELPAGNWEIATRGADGQVTRVELDVPPGGAAEIPAATPGAVGPR